MEVYVHESPRVVVRVGDLAYELSFLAIGRYTGWYQWHTSEDRRWVRTGRRQSNGMSGKISKDKDRRGKPKDQGTTNSTSQHGGTLRDISHAKHP